MSTIQNTANDPSNEKPEVNMKLEPLDFSGYNVPGLVPVTPEISPMNEMIYPLPSPVAGRPPTTNNLLPLNSVISNQNLSDLPMNLGHSPDFSGLNPALPLDPGIMDQLSGIYAPDLSLGLNGNPFGTISDNLVKQQVPIQLAKPTFFNNSNNHNENQIPKLILKKETLSKNLGQKNNENNKINPMNRSQNNSSHNSYLHDWFQGPFIFQIYFDTNDKHSMLDAKFNSLIGVNSTPLPSGLPNFHGPNALFPSPTASLTLPNFQNPSNLKTPITAPANFLMNQSRAPKSAPYTWSHSLCKLFVKMDTPCPVNIRLEHPAPPGCIIRITAVFRKTEHQSDIVTRCPNHREKEQQVTSKMLKKNLSENSNQHCNSNTNSTDRMSNFNHVVRVDHPRAIYESRKISHHILSGNLNLPDPVEIANLGTTNSQDTKKDEKSTKILPTLVRECVTVPYCPPFLGQTKSTIMLRFMCLSSCVGGINRRPFNTVFTLESSNGEILGRNVVETRVCSCPGRDRDAEERRKLVGQSSSFDASHSDSGSGSGNSFDQQNKTDFSINSNDRCGLKRKLGLSNSENSKKLCDKNLAVVADDQEMADLLQKYCQSIRELKILSPHIYNSMISANKNGPDNRNRAVPPSNATVKKMQNQDKAFSCSNAGKIESPRTGSSGTINGGSGNSSDSGKM